MPPPVRSLDDWLKAYAQGDRASMVLLTHHRDQELVAQALEASPTSTLALALPPRPVSHEIDEIVERSEHRYVVSVQLTVKNPLPFASKRIGQALSGIPKTRRLRRRFLVTQVDGNWGVKLDLENVLIRARFASHLLELLAAGRLEEAEAQLAAGVPPPPDDGGRRAEDRLISEIRSRIAKLRSRRKNQN